MDGYTTAVIIDTTIAPEAFYRTMLRTAR